MRLELGGRHVLLLQGPVGPFFRRFAEELRRHGARVTKVNFNAGDALFYRGADTVPFTGSLADWPGVFRRLCGERGIDAVFLFGDCRPVHKAAVAVAGELGIPIWVFEEGYLRPSYVTLEQGGTNGNSSLPRSPDFYRRAAAGLPAQAAAVPVGNTFWIHALWTALHAVAVTFGGWRYPQYRHHRDVNAVRQGLLWLRAGLRKLIYGLKERGVIDRLAGVPFFLVPLQVHCDASLTHSPYGDVTEFIAEVVSAFAARAPRDHLLVVKHHPHDLPYRDYSRLLRRLAAEHGLGERIVYVHDVHLPTLLKHARGVVTMNSTVGLSALYHGAPVKVMGRAIYDIAGLTCQRPLGAFFMDPGQVDHALYDCFSRYLRETCQVNGSFYRRARALGSVSGLDPALLPAGSAPVAGLRLAG